MVLSPADALQRLASAELTPRGFLANASNHTLLVHVGEPADGVAAIYKPREGERPLWDFPRGTLCQREVAAYEVSVALGWGLVPPTTLRDGPLGQGSVQLFVPHDPARHYFVLVEEGHHLEALTRMATFDLLINNADRKASHVLLSEEDGRILGVDHGVAFHALPKLRTVIWDLGSAPIQPSWRADLARLAAQVDRGPLRERLRPLLDEDEVVALAERARLLAERERLPTVAADRRPYPWPPL